MSLLKLWNSLLGRGNDAAAQPHDPTPASDRGRPVAPVIAAPQAKSSETAAATVAPDRGTTRPIGTVAAKPRVVAPAGPHNRARSAEPVATTPVVDRPLKLSRRQRQAARGEAMARARRVKEVPAAKPLVPNTANVAVPLAARVEKAGSKGSHSSVCKLVAEFARRSGQPISVLDIGVGDGQRSLAILQTLLGIRSDVIKHYIVVDTFEMSGGPILLRDFNQLVRTTGVAPKLFPLPVEIGLTRVAHTLGAVDLVLADRQLWSDHPQVAKVMNKLRRPGTLVLVQDAGQWSRLDSEAAVYVQLPRAA